MTPRQRQGYARYVRLIADHMGLTDWRLELHYDGTEPEIAAHVSCVTGRRIAHITLSGDFGTFAPEEQRHVVVHELLHIHLDPMGQYAHDTLPGLLGGPVFTAWITAYRTANENATDAIAAALSPLFPVPMP